jgi:2-oxoacid dehydrogenases acyltransferase (catalytic domain)
VPRSLPHSLPLLLLSLPLFLPPPLLLPYISPSLLLSSCSSTYNPPPPHPLSPSSSQASTAALMEFPAVNGVIDESTNEIVYRNYVDISVAVASPAGQQNNSNIEHLHPSFLAHLIVASISRYSPITPPLTTPLSSLSPRPGGPCVEEH